MKIFSNKKARWTIILLIIFVVAAIRFIHVDAFKIFYFPCAFHKYTGFYCPGCGSSRAMNALFKLEILKAMGHNILVVFAYPAIIYWGIAETLEVYWGIELKRPRLRPKLILLIFWSIVAFWIFRNIPASPFTLLAP